MKRLISKIAETENKENENVDSQINEEEINNDENQQVSNDAEETSSDTIKRLRNEVMEDKMKKNDTNMVLLDQLNEADVRHDKCPNCSYEPLVRKEGFKICPQCGMVYKMLDGSGYVLTE